MTEAKLADTLAKLISPLAAGMGLSLWGLELSFGSRSVVRIYVEKVLPEALGECAESVTENAEGCTQGVSAQGVSIDECADLSRLVGLTLDVEDSIPGSYVLEVSSPGLDRTFFTGVQLAGALGRTVDITLLAPLPDVPGRRKFRGVLTAVPDTSADEKQGGFFSMLAEDCPKPGEFGTINFSFADVKKAKQVYLAPEKSLPGKGGAKQSGGKKSARRNGSSADGSRDEHADG